MGRLFFWWLFLLRPCTTYVQLLPVLVFTLPAVTDDDFCCWFPVCFSKICDSCDYVHSFGDLPKHHMNIVKPWSSFKSYKELRGVSVRSCISHWKHPCFFVLIQKILILEVLSINRFTTCPIPICYITTLNTQPRFNPMKRRPLIAKRTPRNSSGPFFSCAEAPKAFSCLGHILIQLELNGPNLIIIHTDIHPDLGILIRHLWGITFRES
jgi:hypothetical protein